MNNLLAEFTDDEKAILAEVVESLNANSEACAKNVIRNGDSPRKRALIDYIVTPEGYKELCEGSNA